MTTSELRVPEDRFQEFEEDAKRIHFELMRNDSIDHTTPKQITEEIKKDEGVISFKRGDYMIVHSTLRGYVSNRHRVFGTIFVQELTKSIQQLMRKDDHNFEEVIRRACFAVSKHQSSGESAPHVPDLARIQNCRDIS